MARRRKTEAKPSAKLSTAAAATVPATSEKPTAVRKSRRQIAKKQLDKKENGEGTVRVVPQQKSQNESEEPESEGNSNADQTVVQHKKFGKYRCPTEVGGKEQPQHINNSSTKGSESSDSQEVAVELLHEGTAETEMTQMDVNTIVNENCSNEVVWQEDVIEETIEICEEMEVEEGAVEESYTISQEDGSVVLEEVLLVNNHDFEGEGVVEFTVIQNEDGTESMVVARDDQNLSCKDYITNSLALQQRKRAERQVEESDEFQEIEKGVGNITVQESAEADTKDAELTEVSNRLLLGSKSETKTPIKGNDKQTSKVERDDKVSLNCDSENCVENSTFRTAGNAKVSPESGDTNVSVDSSAISLDLPVNLDSDINFISNVTAENNVQTELNANRCTQSSENIRTDNLISKSAKKVEDTEKPHCSIEDECSSGEKPMQRLEATKSGDNVAASKVVGKEKSANNIVDESSSGDSEMDIKADTEDIKMSSSSENSNDTLISGNSGYKLPEFTDVKNIPNQQNDVEKKTGFRSRSGSTDTTGSESGSNSSGVRRSSRIRTIGLMKQRSRGRGLVTKPNLDLSRAVFQHQEREKLLTSSSALSQDNSKDNSDNQSETQSDRENGGNKTVGIFDSPAPLSALSGTAGYESDTSKPVKVKSRWRRSSELEMGGNGSSTKVHQLQSEGDVSAEINLPLVLGSPSADLSLVAVASKVNVGRNSMLPTVLEVKDKEMEERLSQFEHLTENLYLTERYTNKETKRMVCDCFLTEEEIARGELGCGEDCLNRLLMIECGPRCVVGDRCTNKRFQNCEYAKCEVFRTDKKGFGLRAIVDLQSGEFLMEYVGEVVDPKDFRRRAKDYSKDKNRHYYFMALKSDQIIDATAKGNISRFINHSCDPNSETQKWTVNGELRIGFFNKQFIAAGEEITFDYHFQRYGKEAQKCYCEAENCRGWIGERPDEETEKTEKKEKTEKDVTKKKKEEKKIHDYTEDEDLEEEIEKLCAGGLKNRAHTLTLSRLMVRSRELEHRTRLLRLIQSGEQPCRRLFLDYHGLRLIWSYTMDVGSNTSSEAQNFRLEILRTLSTLPIPNKTMLMDSKIFAVVEKWAKQLYSSPTISGSPEDEDSVKPKLNSDEPDSSCDIDSNEKLASTDPVIPGSDPGKGLKELDVSITEHISEVKNDPEDVAKALEEQTAFTELANSLLCEWSNLKEVFRIPKKERIEQMKEHEREADRGYKEDLEKEDRRDKSYERYGRSDSGSTEKRSDRRRGRDSPEFDYSSRGKEKRVEERVNLVPIPRMSKHERRQLFAMKVAKEEEERQRRQQQETWQEHEARCLALGMDPHTTAALDPQTGYPLFFNPSLGQWQHYPPIQDAADLTVQCAPVYLGGSQPLAVQSGIMGQTQHLIPPGVPPPVVFPQTQQQQQLNSVGAYAPLLGAHHHDHQFADSQLRISGNLIPIQNGSTTAAAAAVSQVGIHPDPASIYAGDKMPEGLENAEVASPPPLDLPPKWKSAKDSRGRTYYYNVNERISQWLPPPPDHLAALPETSSSSESSDESSSSDEAEDEELEEDEDEDIGADETVCQMDVDLAVSNQAALAALKSNFAEKFDAVAGDEASSIIISEPKKRRDGLVQERIISPRREDERVDHKKYKETKEKLRRQKEKAKLKEHVEKLKKHRRGGKSKSHSRTSHTLSKIQAITADPSVTLERKIKDTFRINMANVMVHFLNPYRKNDCKQGRITNTEDFKHLARKLTHFVLAKELKHCKSVDELQCNENVKHKAKDFVRKYMNKFGPVYQKGSDED
ncbi:probable histone-lysine N-methyltransferase CG1716 isoform X2 [Diprion similis]|uniref:probable histone-lysine N-methyltransferase CG1716 isoform X2 n=1 Tax=Diprion similis TaxID=362088 RepID=UPI001EF8136A|nr:probable histone-lysine N-methyltransferase CG1716 isoform X2 [Diprion similis]